MSEITEFSIKRQFSDYNNILVYIVHAVHTTC